MDDDEPNESVWKNFLKDPYKTLDPVRHLIADARQSIKSALYAGAFIGVTGLFLIGMGSWLFPDQRQAIFELFKSLFSIVIWFMIVAFFGSAILDFFNRQR